jgi:hypothetical protein
MELESDQILFDVRGALMVDGDRHLAGRLEEDGCDWHSGDRQLFVAQFGDLEIVQQYLVVRYVGKEYIEYSSTNHSVRVVCKTY